MSNYCSGPRRMIGQHHCWKPSETMLVKTILIIQSLWSAMDSMREIIMERSRLRMTRVSWRTRTIPMKQMPRKMATMKRTPRSIRTVWTAMIILNRPRVLILGERGFKHINTKYSSLLQFERFSNIYIFYSEYKLSWMSFSWMLSD